LVFFERRSGVEAYELLRARETPGLPFRTFLSELRETYKAATAGRRGHVMRGLGPPPGPEPVRATTGVTAERSERLQHALHSLSDPGQRAVQLYVMHGRPAAEAASPRGLPINTEFNEQGPTVSNDELSLYFGSDRPGGIGGFDIWVARRACTGCPWEAPTNLGPVVNSAFDETGPGLSIDGHLLFFRSTRPGGQGLGDIYLSNRADPKDDVGWNAPVALGPDVNTAAAEAGAEYLQSAEDGSPNPYFNRAPPGGTADLYDAAITRDGETRGPAVLIAELSDPVATDQGPTLRTDGREIFFFSTRSGGVGGAD